MATKKSKSKNETPPQILTSEQLHLLNLVLDQYDKKLDQLHWDIARRATVKESKSHLEHIVREREEVEQIKKIVGRIFESQFESEQPRTGWVLQPFKK